MKPYYADDSVTLYHGDMREVLPALDERPDCIVTDPPYGETKARVGCMAGQLAEPRRQRHPFHVVLRVAPPVRRALAGVRRLEAIAGRGVGEAQRVRVPRRPVQPVGLLDPLIRYACPPGGLVLDPFAGAGSTAAAARLSGRRAVLIEADERYCEAITRRLAQDVLPLGGLL